jgi:hypothetical protein
MVAFDAKGEGDSRISDFAVTVLQLSDIFHVVQILLDIGDIVTSDTAK